MTTRGLREVPRPSVRTIVDAKGVTHKVAEFTEEHRNFLVDLREQIIQLRNRQAAIGPPTNPVATAQAFSNLFQWTRTTEADYYEVLHSTTPNINDAQIVDVGNSALWVDHVGNVGIKKFYWVRGRRHTGGASTETGVVSATTLAAATGVTPPLPPPPSDIIIVDRATGRQIPYTLADAGRLNQL